MSDLLDIPNEIEALWLIGQSVSDEALPCLRGAAYKFKEKFGQWPAHRLVTPLPPSPEVKAWDRHCRIRYAKSQQRGAAHG
jgi:hypothetical protein